MKLADGGDVLAALEKLAQEGCRAAEEGDLPALEEGLRLRRALLPRIEQAVVGARTQPETNELVRRLERILDVDREAERHLNRGREELEERVSSIERGERGLRAYAGGGLSRGKRVDERR